MSDPDAEIADLDFSLAEDGQTITLRKVINGSTIVSSVECAAFVRGYKPDQFVGGLTQQDAKVIMSPTEINTAGWPGPPDSPPAAVDRRIPVKGDKAVINGKPRNIEAAVGIYVADVLVRIEMQVKG